MFHISSSYKCIGDIICIVTYSNKHYILPTILKPHIEIKERKQIIQWSYPTK